MDIPRPVLKPAFDITRASHAVLRVRDIAKSRAFYVDAIGMLGLKLDSGKGRAGTGLFPTGSDGRSQDDYSKGGGAVKFRISDTVLKVGDQFTALPVFATDDSRLLPEIAQGTLITSNEIEGLTLHAGHFTSLTAQAQTNREARRARRMQLERTSGGMTESRREGSVAGGFRL